LEDSIAHELHYCLIIIGDFNGKVGDKKEKDIVGPFGLQGC